MDVYYTGAMFPSAWNNRTSEAKSRYVAPVPAINEEYFEWIDLLISVWQAKETFTMVELGAGYGRWGISGLMAAADRDLRSQIAFVEPEPRHCEWLDEAVDRHFGDPRNEGFAEVYERAIAYGRESVPFLVRQGDMNETNWFGQYVPTIEDGETTDRIYHGCTVFRSRSQPECEYISIEPITLASVLDRFGRVDLIDMDLQGMERDLVEHEMEVLTAKVHKVHIGTHSGLAEGYIRERFLSAGWFNIWDFSSGKMTNTPYGPIDFQDGVQTWENPNV